MSDQRVANMTLEELKAFVDSAIDHRMQSWYKIAPRRSVKEINEEIRRLRWTPPPGSPSTLEMIREDRDR